MDLLYSFFVYFLNTSGTMRSLIWKGDDMEESTEATGSSEDDSNDEGSDDGEEDDNDEDDGSDDENECRERKMSVFSDRRRPVDVGGIRTEIEGSLFSNQLID